MASAKVQKLPLPIRLRTPMPAIRSELVEITPDDAKALLAHSEQQLKAKPLLIGGKPFKNRHLVRSRVEAIKRSIANGTWVVTHQGIALSTEMIVLDGQHRLTAIAEGATPVKMMVAYDVPPEAFLQMDRNRPRDMAFVLGLSKQIAAQLRLGWILTQTARDAVPSPDDLVATQAWLMPALEQVEAVSGRKGDGRMPASVHLACAARILNGQGEHALQCHQALTHLDYLKLPPIVAQFLRQMQSGKVDPRGNDGQRETLARAWVAYDPDKANIGRLLIENVDVVVERVAAVLRRAQAAV